MECAHDHNFSRKYILGKSTVYSQELIKKIQLKDDPQVNNYVEFYEAFYNNNEVL